MPKRSLNRRDVLQLVGLGAGAAVMATFSRDLHAEPEVWNTESIWPGHTPVKVLEIYLYGGLSPWETFYHRPGRQGWAGLEGDFDNLQWRESKFRPNQPLETRRFLGEDGDEDRLELGPMTKPVWDSALEQRMRIIVCKHGLPPHEAAIPQALTGLPLGSPRAAGMGTVVRRRFMAEERDLPVGLAYFPGFVPSVDNVSAAAAVGFHEARYQPLVVPMTEQFPQFRGRFERRHLSPPDAFDPAARGKVDHLRSLYHAELRARLRWQSQSGLNEYVRSKALSEYDSAMQAVARAPRLNEMFAALPFYSASEAAWVVDPARPPLGPAFNTPRNAIAQGVALLNRHEGARYVCVVDNGLHYAEGGGGYDTHQGDHAMITSSNLFNTLLTLRELLDNGQLDLDTTLVLINTEFGRKPVRDEALGGRDHWPFGYVSTLIGGPSAAHSVYGYINPTSAIAAPGLFASPLDLRAAVMLAAGINPFVNRDVFDPSQISPHLRDPDAQNPTALATARKLIREILGVKLSP